MNLKIFIFFQTNQPLINKKNFKKDVEIKLKRDPSTRNRFNIYIAIRDINNYYQSSRALCQTCEERELKKL